MKQLRYRRVFTIAGIAVHDPRNPRSGSRNQRSRCRNRCSGSAGISVQDRPEYPRVAEKIRSADIVIFATPIWWGGRSSLMQRVIERLDAFDEDAATSGRSALLNKVAGVVITGSEDGAQATLAGIMEVLTFLNFTLPPQCCAYWVGEVGMPPSEDRAKRLANDSTKHMAKNMAKNMARNLVFYAQLLKRHPLVPEGP